MKKISEGVILVNTETAPGIFRMDIALPDIAGTAAAGQFVELYVDMGEHILPRPISICAVDPEKSYITLVYQMVGDGTKYFSELRTGSRIRVIGPLGKGFRIVDSDYVLVGGGVGVPPLLQLAAELREKNEERTITAFLGFRSQPFLKDEFEKYCDQVYIATDDGSVGFKGSVLQLMEQRHVDGMICACGPRGMLKALAGRTARDDMPCQVSMEERMACGVGACVGCVIKIKNSDGWEYKKVCADGPVFDAREVVWDD